MTAVRTAKLGASRGAWRPLLLALAAALLPLSAAPAHAESRWLLEAVGVAATPTQPQIFVDGWGKGLGIGGSLRRQVGRRFEVGADAEFVQFTYEGLSDVGEFGGERRLTRLAVPVRVHLWENQGTGHERLSLQASAGWGHQSVAATDGLPATLKSQDGLAVTGEFRFSRILYRGTRWSAGLRYTWFDLDAESPGHFGVVLGVEMPLQGSRPR